MKENIKKEIEEILDSMGIIIFDTSEDVDLAEYIEDSLQFINFIVEVEQKFGVEIPSQNLMMDSMSTLNGFVNLILQLIGEGQESAN